MDLAGLIKNMEGLTGRGQGRIRKALLPVFKELTAKSYKTYYDKLHRNSVSPDLGGANTVASGRLLRAFERDATKLVTEGPDGIRFALRINSSAATKRHSDPSEYYDVIDGSKERSVPSVDRIIQWLVDRRVIDSIHDAFMDGTNGHQLPTRVVAVRIRARIAERIQADAYTRLNITEALQKRMDVSNPESFIRKATRYTLRRLVLESDAPF